MHTEVVDEGHEGSYLTIGEDTKYLEDDGSFKEEEDVHK